MLRKTLRLFALAGFLVTAGLVAGDIFITINPNDIREVTLVDIDSGVKEVYRVDEIDPRVLELPKMKDKEAAKALALEIAKDIRNNYKPTKRTNLTPDEISKVKSDAQWFWRWCGWRRWVNPWFWGSCWTTFYPWGGWWGWGFGFC